MMRERYSSNLAMIDVVFNMTLGIMSMFIIAFLLIKESEFKSPLDEPPAELLITFQWDDESYSDVDGWTQFGPDDSDAVGFRSPTRGGVSLDIDDLGARTDRILRKGKAEAEVIPINREVITFRYIPADEIIVNAMLYYSQDKNTKEEVTVTVVKLNPFKIIYEGRHTLRGRGDEHTFVRFTLDDNGEVTDLHHRQKSIVYAAHPSPGEGTWPTSHDMDGSPQQPAAGSAGAGSMMNYEYHTGGGI